VLIVVEVGDWEHECCGSAFERDSVIEITCLVVPAHDDHPVRYVESHHDLGPARDPGRERDTIEVRGRVADLHIEHPDGSTEQIDRLPSGRALRGFDDRDEGHLERPWTGAPVTNDSNRYLLTIAT